jgi:predicted  nucleic acid-binding Zn-ribbon protein
MEMANLSNIALWATIVSPIVAILIAAITIIITSCSNRKVVQRMSKDAQRQIDAIQKQAAETNRLTRIQLSLAVENYRLESYKTQSRLAEVEAKIKEVENDRTPGAVFSTSKDPRLKSLEDEKKHLETHLQQLKRVISDCQTAIMKIDLENKKI